MYEIEWLGPPQTDSPPQILGREPVAGKRLECAVAQARSAFVELCQLGRRPYGYRIRDGAQRIVWIWGAHDGPCENCSGYGKSGRGSACPMHWRAEGSPGGAAD